MDLSSVLRAVLLPAISGAVAAIISVFVLRRRARIEWQEGARGHLAKLRHEALAKCLAGVGELFEVHMARQGADSDVESDVALARYMQDAAKPLQKVAAHEFMLPPELRQAVSDLIRTIQPGGFCRDLTDDVADKLSRAVDRYLPPIDARPLGDALRKKG